MCDLLIYLLLLVNCKKQRFSGFSRKKMTKINIFLALTCKNK